MQPPHQQDANVPYLRREMSLGMAYLEQAGISAVILDLNSSEQPSSEPIEALKTLRPRFVGISSFTMDSMKANRLAGRCRESMPAKALPQRTLAECEHFDYLIHGQGEPLTQLIQHIRRRRDVCGISGLAYRSNGSITVTPVTGVSHWTNDLVRCHRG